MFEQARRAAPCILVLEDPDSLVKAAHRSELLNELDGFAANTSVLTLATTNHPEKLDAALIHRPSRFDRIYRFELPETATRQAHISRRNDSLQPALRLEDVVVADLAEQTDGLSFAFLKELFVSSTRGWMATQEVGGMAAVVSEQLTVLRHQLRATAKAAARQPAMAGSNGNGRQWPYNGFPGAAVRMGTRGWQGSALGGHVVAGTGVGVASMISRSRSCTRSQAQTALIPPGVTDP